MMTNSERQAIADKIEAAWERDQERQQREAHAIEWSCSGMWDRCRCDTMMSTRKS